MSATGDTAEYDIDELAMAAERLPTPVVVVDDGGITHFANRLYCHLLGLSPSAVMANTLMETVVGDDVDQQIESFFATDPGCTTGPYEMSTRRSDGSTFVGSWTVRRDEETQLYVAVLLDITDGYEQHRELQAKARTDHLTALMNRSGLAAAADKTHAGKDFSIVAVVDLDRFKMVNDLFGHAAGDRLLTTVAQRLPAVVPKGSMVARMGGDEFAVLLSPSAELLPKELGARLMTVFDDHVSVQGLKLPVAASIGVSSGATRACLDELLREADAAAYEAKRRGGSRFVIANDTIVEDQHRKIHLQQQIRQAIGTGQFVPWFQPIVRLADKAVVAHESLVRWVRSTNHTVAGGEFIEAAVETGMFSQMSGEARQLAIAAAADWPDKITLALNLSAGELLEQDVVAKLLDQLQSSGLSPSRVMVEVNESVLADHSDAAARAVRALVGRGFQIAIDNFGAESTSLRLLARLPIDAIKLDAGLVSECRANSRGDNLLAGLIDTLLALDVYLIAQGVETREDHDYVQRMGIHYGQGWLYQPPEPLSTLTADGSQATTLIDSRDR